MLVKHLTFPAPQSLRSDSHVRDARLWLYVERQRILTVEDIEVENGVCSVLFALDEPPLAKMGEFLQHFAEYFGA